MSLDIVSELLCGMLAGKRIGIIAIGEEQHLDVHSLRQEHISTTHGGMDTRLVAIVKQRDVLGETPEQLDLIDGECRATVGHHIFQSTLVHRNHVGITFHHIDTVFLGNGLLGLIESVELTFLMVDL